MSRRWSLVVGALLATAELGCKPACDEAGLRRAAAAFANGSLDERRAGIEALGQVCPTLPSSLRWSLLADLTELPLDQQAAVYVDRTSDPRWNELLVRTCPGALEPLERGTPSAAYGRVMRQTCELDRFGLLAPDDVVAYRDLGPFMLHEWLVWQRVDPALAKDVVRPLLTVHAASKELEALCLRDELPCDSLVETWGLQPPRSTMDVPLQRGPAVLITDSAISVDRVPVLELVAGQAPNDGFVHHVSGPLQQRLETYAEANPAARDEATLVLAADRATPFATLADTAFTAAKVGFTTFDLVVRGEHGLRRLPLFVPRGWTERPLERKGRPLELLFVVHRDAVEARGPGGLTTSFVEPAACEPLPADCLDHEAIGRFAAELKQQYPSETVARFRVDGDVPLLTLVAIVDTVRGGEGCSMEAAAAGLEIPETCLFFIPIVDLEPSLSFTEHAGP